MRELKITFYWLIGILVFVYTMTLVAQFDLQIEESQKVECLSKGGTFIQDLYRGRHHHNMCEFK